jgi:hypothetical protein
LEIAVPAAYALLLILIIYKVRFVNVQGLTPARVTAVFALKIMCGVAMALIYTYYYTDRTTADVFKYYDDSRIMYDALRTHPADFFRMLTGIGDDGDHFRNTYYLRMANWYRDFESTFNDSRTIIRVNAFIRLFSFGYYHVHTVIMCFLSLTGLVAIYRTFSPYMEDRRNLLFAAVFLLPSVMFWGSGVLKEGIMLCGLGILVYSFHRMLNGGITIKRTLLVLLSLGILLVTKYYILAALIIGMVANLWIYRSSKKNTLMKYAIVIACFAAAGWLYISTKPVYDPLQIMSSKQRNFLNLARGGAYMANDSILVYIPHEQKSSIIETGKDSILAIEQGTRFMYWYLDNNQDTLYTASASDTITYHLWWDIVPSGSRVDVPPLEPTLASFLSHTPRALINTLFRPHIAEARNPFMLMSAFENLLIILLILLAIFFYRPPVSPPLFWFCIFFTLFLFIITGLVTPVLGALVRYKMPALPFLAIGLMMIIDLQKLARWLPFKKARN